MTTVVAFDPAGAAGEAQLRKHAAAITSVLRRVYGRRQSRSSRHPTDSLLATILSQHTADRNSHVAYERLGARYGSWEEIAYGDEGELADTIRVAGLANFRARRIQQTLRTLDERYGSMDLAFLRALSLREAQEVLLTLPGVGPKTAACVLLFSCDLSTLPVDTHVHRVARRLGLLGSRTSAERAHDELERLVPPDDAYDFHVNLIAHGRRVCHARDPKCGACPLQHLCASYSRGAA